VPRHERQIGNPGKQGIAGDRESEHISPILAFKEKLEHDNPFTALGATIYGLRRAERGQLPPSIRTCNNVTKPAWQHP
jgi:hypothetical protein